MTCHATQGPHRRCTLPHAKNNLNARMADGDALPKHDLDDHQERPEVRGMLGCVQNASVGGQTYAFSKASFAKE